MSLIKNKDGSNVWGCDNCGKETGYPWLESSELAEYTYDYKPVFSAVITKTKWLPKTHICSDCVIAVVMAKK